MARFGRSCARSIFAAVTLACLIGMTPAVGETVLRIANLAEPETLDPHKVVAHVEITRNLYEGLVVLDPKGNVAAGVAESWTVSEDGLVYRFNLRSRHKLRSTVVLVAHQQWAHAATLASL